MAGSVRSLETLAMLNEIVPHATAEGAYCAGLISALAWSKGEDPPRALIEMAVTCTNIAQAGLIWDQFWSLRARSVEAHLAAERVKEKVTFL